TGCAAGCGHCGRQGAGCGDVVFLDQHLVEEADAVVLAAATHDRVFLRRPESWDRLSRIQNCATGSHDRVYIAASGRRRCGKELEEVERSALTREYGPGQARDLK